MRMFDPPGCHLVEQPEAIDAQRDESEEPPFDVAAEELQTCSIKSETLAVDDRIAADPAAEHNFAPRVGDSERTNRNDD